MSQKKPCDDISNHFYKFFSPSAIKNDESNANLVWFQQISRFEIYIVPSNEYRRIVLISP